MEILILVLPVVLEHAVQSAVRTSNPYAAEIADTVFDYWDSLDGHTQIQILHYVEEAFRAHERWKEECPPAEYDDPMGGYASSWEKVRKLRVGVPSGGKAVKTITL